MAEERALASAPAPAQSDRELSKHELQQRMDEARDSISNTVTEIKETVAHQVQTVKETLDWREQYRRRPVAWSLGALGTGLLIGYKLGSVFQGEETEFDSAGGYVYAAAPPALPERTSILETEAPTNGKAEEGPGIFERFRETPAYDRLRSEVGTIGNRLVEELSTTAQTLVLPLLIGKIKQFIGVDLSSQGATDTRGQEREQTQERNVYPRVSS